MNTLRCCNPFTKIAIFVIVVGGNLFVQGCEPDPSSSPNIPPPEPVSVRDWRVQEPRDVVRLPNGQVQLCDDKAVSINDCQFATFLDAEWPVERVLHEYPFFDPEKAAQRIWRNAQRRKMFDHTGDSNWWTPESFPDRLAERDEAAARMARMWGGDWRRYFVEPGYRDLIAWRRQVFDDIQIAENDSDLEQIPSCDEQQRILEHLALCDVAEFVSTDWTFERAVQEFEGLDESDSMLIMELIRSDARDRKDSIDDPSVYSWSTGNVRNRLASRSVDRLHARRRLLASGEFDFLREPPTAGRANLGPLVRECLDRCVFPDGDSDEEYQEYLACEATCYSTDFGLQP